MFVFREYENFLSAFGKTDIGEKIEKDNKT